MFLFAEEYEIKVNEIVTILDKNRSGKIDFQEFKALYAENASEIFHQLDIESFLVYKNYQKYL